MTIRLYRPEDCAELERMHQAQGFEYEFPNIDADPLYFLKMVTEKDGKIVNAAVAHLTAEMYFLADPHAGKPQERFSNFVALHESFCEVAYRQGGLSDLHAWIPPQVARPFGRRLKRLGWKRPLWTSYAKELGR
jgi:hypothetical protein